MCHPCQERETFSNATAWLQVRCHPTAKAAWVKAAGGKSKLSKWVKQELNRAAEQNNNER